MAGKRQGTAETLGPYSRPQRSPAVVAGKSDLQARIDRVHGKPQRSPAVVAGKSYERFCDNWCGPVAPQRSPAVVAGKSRAGITAQAVDGAAATEPGRGGREEVTKAETATERRFAATEPGRGGREELRRCPPAG